MSNSYEDKKQARIDRYRERAERASNESNRLHKQSHDMVSGIPPGQPILVGHHSEKAHRRLLDRSWNTLGKAVEASDKAAYYAEKAAAAESNTSISSDDPDAISKLEDKLERLTGTHEHMKKLNAHYRKHGTCNGFDNLSDEKAAQLDERIKDDYSFNQVPYPQYALTNSNAEINRIKKRIASLKSNQEIGFVGWKFDGGEVVANADENRLQIFFDEKPDESKREAMKARGFKFSKYNNNAWQRQLNGNAVYAASRLDFIRPESGIDPCKLQSRKKDRPEPERGESR